MFCQSLLAKVQNRPSKVRTFGEKSLDTPSHRVFAVVVGFGEESCQRFGKLLLTELIGLTGGVEDITTDLGSKINDVADQTTRKTSIASIVSKP